MSIVCAKLQASLDVWVPLGFVTTTLMVSLMLAEESKLSRMDTAELWSVYTHGLVAVLWNAAVSVGLPQSGLRVDSDGGALVRPHDWRKRWALEVSS